MRCPNQVVLNKWVDFIHEEGFATGSRVIGGYTKDSDRDFVMLFDVAIEKAERLGLEMSFKLKTEEERKEYGPFLSLQYSKEEKEPWTNLILVWDEIDLGAWKDATYEFNELREVCPQLSYIRGRRHLLFQWFMNDYYRFVGYPERAFRDEGSFTNLSGNTIKINPAK